MGGTMLEAVIGLSRSFMTAEGSPLGPALGDENEL
jgi:hypothetical protein